MSLGESKDNVSARQELLEFLETAYSALTSRKNKQEYGREDKQECNLRALIEIKNHLNKLLSCLAKQDRDYFYLRLGGLYKNAANRVSEEARSDLEKIGQSWLTLSAHYLNLRSVRHPSRVKPGYSIYKNL